MHDATLERLLAGRLIADRYRLGEVIGRGGMSTVYLATDERLGRRVALKVISLPTRTDAEREDARTRFRREAAAAAQIPPHPNVVQIYDYGTDAALDLDYLVMEFLHGRDLKQALAERKFSAEEGQRIILEAARGVSAGHRAGFVHRDIKPANIFLLGEEQLEGVRILDFGIAKAVEGYDTELTRLGVQPHSPAYASPEQLRSEPVITQSSDVYQLALVAYEVLSGSRARPLDSSGQTHPEPVLSWLDAPGPGAVQDVLRRALADDPASRFSDASEFIAAFADAHDVASATATTVFVPGRDTGDETLLDPEPVAAPPLGVRVDRPPRQVETGPLPRKHARLVKASIAVVGVLIGFALASRSPAVDEPRLAQSAEVQELEAEFRQLHSAAAAALQREASPLEGAVAAEAVQQVVMDLYNALVLGQLDRHLSHYASRVDFYDRRNTRRSAIERDRQRLVSRYPEREIVIERHAIEFPEPGRARVLIDQRWRFATDRMEWQGSGRQEMMLESQDGRWLVVAEKNLDETRWDRAP